ncbi:MAG: glucose 1-dehydrogenase [Chlamydiae bacterium]|nr:glucose 1-dehydrogenase [Chlamydiota bacterium]
MMEEMNGKVAIITGATFGIGREAAILFAEQGIKVVAAGRSEKEGSLLVDEILSKKGEAVFVKTDVAKEESVKQLIAAALKKFGKLDLCFNNAGVEGVLAPLIDLEEKDWDSTMGINLKGLWLCLKHEIPAIIKNGGGAIVNTSSIISKNGMPGTTIYAASKAGVDALTHVAAVEYGDRKIRVNAINPGAVATPMLERVYTQDLANLVKNKNPLQKIALPRDIANAALWLCSSYAGHINGITLPIDGGHSLLT